MGKDKKSVEDARTYFARVGADLIAHFARLGSKYVELETDEAVREAESRLLGVETNITNWQRKQNMNNNFSATVPYDIMPLSAVA